MGPPEEKLAGQLTGMDQSTPTSHVIYSRDRPDWSTLSMEVAPLRLSQSTVEGK